MILTTSYNCSQVTGLNIGTNTSYTLMTSTGAPPTVVTSEWAQNWHQQKSLSILGARPTCPLSPGSPIEASSSRGAADLMNLPEVHGPGHAAQLCDATHQPRRRGRWLRRDIAGMPQRWNDGSNISARFILSLYDLYDIYDTKDIPIVFFSPGHFADRS